MTKAPDMGILFVLLTFAIDLIVFSLKATVVTVGAIAVIKAWKQPIIYK